eukprot:165007_1
MATYVHINKSQIISHYIQTISISNDNKLKVQVDLTEAPKKKIFFYIYQYGKEQEDDLAVICITKKKTTNTIELDLKDVADTSFKIALYENENDTKMNEEENDDKT